MSVKEIPVHDWDELMGRFENLDSGWLFRGQCDSAWGLSSSLERHAPPDIERRVAESRLLYEFKRRAHIYLAGHQMPPADEDAEWLALMQHFGAPTRLIDVTRSPYVATYFAVEDTREGTSECAVWAVNRRWCVEAAGAVVLKTMPLETRQTLDEIAAAGGFANTPELIQGMRSSSLHGDKWRTFNRMPLVVPFVPERLSERLSIQQGEFLVPREVNRTFMENLAALGDSQSNVVKYRIPSHRRGHILERLRIMNLTRTQLFPGLDGFAQSFRQLLLAESPEDRLERLRRNVLRDYLTMRSADLDE